MELTRENLLQLSRSDFDLVKAGNYDAMSEEGRRIIGVGKSGSLDMLSAGTSVVGSLLGAVAGTAAAPGLGTAAGTVAGGAIGAGIGEWVENKISGESGGIGKEMLTSAAWDAGTMGAGKVLRPAFQLAGGRLRTLFGKPAAEITGELRSIIAREAPESLSDATAGVVAAQSQDMALKRGASLPPSLMESATWYQKVAEQVGKVGMISKHFAADDAGKLLDAVKGGFDDIIKKADDVALNPEDAGQRFVAAIEAGKKAASDIYEIGLNDVQSKLSGVTTTKQSHIIAGINKFIKENTPEAVGKELKGINPTNLADAAFAQANEALTLLKANTYTGNGLISFQKKIRNSISEAYSANNSRLVSQLTELESVIKDGIEKSLNDAAPGIGEAYTKLNSEYAKAMRGLVPEVNESIIRGAMKGRASALGAHLVRGSGTSEQARLFMSSIDEAVKQVAIKDKKGAKWAAEESLRLKRQIRAGYVWNMTNELGEKTMSKGFINNILQPKDKAKMKAIFGDEWNDVKKAMNMAELVSREKKGLGILSLAINGAQITAAGNAAYQSYAAISNGGEAPEGALVSAAFILASPVVFYKIATRPQAINRLIALDNKVAKQGLKNMKPEAVMSALGKIMSSLPAEDKAEARAVAAELGFPIYF